MKMEETIYKGRKCTVTLVNDKEAIKKIGPRHNNGDFNPFNESFHYPLSYYWQKEKAVLKAFKFISESRGIPNIVPDYIGESAAEDGQSFEIRMEYVGKETYKDKLGHAKNWEEITRLDAEVLELTALFHSIAAENVSTILESGKWQTPIAHHDSHDTGPGTYNNGFTYSIKMRDPHEDRMRYFNYFRNGICNASQDFLEKKGFGQRLYNLKKQTNDRLRETNDHERKKKLHSNANKKYKEIVKEYLTAKGINLSDFVNSILRAKYEIFYDVKNELWETTMRNIARSPNDVKALLSDGRVALIHGDIGPHQISATGKIFDFDECRLGSPAEDIANILYNNFHGVPDTERKELDLEEVAREHYFKKCELFKNEGLQSPALFPGEKRIGSEEAFKDFYLRLVRARAVEGGIVRFLGTDSRMPLNEYRSLHGGEISDEGRFEEKKYDLLLKKRVEQFKWIVSYFLQGNGFSRYLEGHRYNDNIQKTLSSIQDLFKKTKIIRD